MSPGDSTFLPSILCAWVSYLAIDLSTFIKSIKETSSQYIKILFHITVETFEGEAHVLKTKHKYFS